MINWRQRTAEIAVEEGIPAWLFVRQIGQESGFAEDVINGTRRSSAGAAGIAQLMPPHWEAVDPLNPEAALRYGARLMAGHYQKYGNWAHALAAYNAGPGAVDKYGGVPPYAETRQYVSEILGSPEEGDDQLAPPTYDESTYKRVLEDLTRHEKMVAGYQSIYDQAYQLLNTGSGLDAATRERFRGAVTSMAEALGLVDPGSKAPVPIPAVMQALNAQIKFEQEQIDSSADQLFTINPNLAATQKPGLANKKRLEAAGVDLSAPSKNQVAQVLQGPDGSISVVMNDGTVTDKGKFPQFAKGTAYTFQTDRSGALVAINPNDPKDRVVVDKNFGFAEIDPAVLRTDSIDQHKDNIGIAQQQVAASFAGVEVQRRGIMVSALGQDMANQVAIGRMTYDEAQLNLDRIDKAFTQRRLERDQMLQYAVSRTSLRVNSAGEQVTALPGGAQLAAILSQSTGQHFDPSIADLPTMTIDPQRTAQQLIDASRYDSPIPGLRSSLDATRQAVGAIVGAPLATKITADAATGAALKGM